MVLTITHVLLGPVSQTPRHHIRLYVPALFLKYSHIYLGGRHAYICTCTINTLKKTTSRPHTSKGWTVLALPFCLSLFLSRFAKLSFHYIIKVSHQLSFRHFFTGHAVVVSPQDDVDGHVYLQRVSLYYSSSLHRVTPGKRNNIRRTLESIFLSRRWYIAFEKYGDTRVAATFERLLKI